MLNVRARGRAMRALLTTNANTESYIDLRPHKARRPRVASEKSDIAYLLAALKNLADLVTSDVLGMPGSGTGAKQYPYLREAIWTAREAAIRVSKNAREREARAKAKR